MHALIDTHSHFDVAEFDADRSAALERAQAAGVVAQIVPAITAETWPRLRAVCAADPGLHAAYGLHPTFLAEHRPEHLAALRDWIERERPVAVGECGLDHYVDGLDPQAQLNYFRGQLELAREFELPVIVHARRAVEEVIAELRRAGVTRGVVHSYGGSAEQAAQLWKLGICLGFGGPITYDRARKLRAIVASMPLEQLLLETDAPDQPLATHRGERNEPARLSEVLHTAAQLRGASVESIAAATTANAKRVFRL